MYITGYIYIKVATLRFAPSIQTKTWGAGGGGGGRWGGGGGMWFVLILKKEDTFRTISDIYRMLWVSKVGIASPDTCNA